MNQIQFNHENITRVVERKLLIKIKLKEHWKECKKNMRMNKRNDSSNNTLITQSFIKNLTYFLIDHFSVNKLKFYQNEYHFHKIHATCLKASVIYKTLGLFSLRIALVLLMSLISSGKC